MFHVIDSKSFQPVSDDGRSSQSQHPPAPTYSVRTPMVSTRNIVIGASNRSRSGCLVCRKRKKKCDETYPVCNACKLRDATCVWGPNKPTGQKYDSSSLSSSASHSRVSKASRKPSPPKQTAVGTSSLDPPEVPNYSSSAPVFSNESSFSEYQYDHPQFDPRQGRSPLQHQHQHLHPHQHQHQHQHQLQNHIAPPQQNVPPSHSHVQSASHSQDLYFQNYTQLPHHSQTLSPASRTQSLSQLQTNFDAPQPGAAEPLHKLSQQQHLLQLHLHLQPQTQDLLSQAVEEVYTPNAHNLVSKTTTPVMGSVAEFVNTGTLSPWLANSLFTGGTTPTSFSDFESIFSLMVQGVDNDLYSNPISLDVGMEDHNSLMVQQQFMQQLNATHAFESLNPPNMVMQSLLAAYARISPTNTINPSSFSNLEDIAMHYMHSFVDKVARELCIGPESSNYLLRTFFELAGKENSISYALSSWGGLFLNEEGSKQYVQKYRAKADLLMLKKRSNSSYYDAEKYKYDTYVLLNYNMIQMSIDVCAGDTKEWYDFFKKIIDLIKKEGGLLKVCKTFGYSEHILWLLADVQYHDILSSRAFSRGTYFEIEDYNKIFYPARKAGIEQQSTSLGFPMKDVGVYGIDPLQGCLQPIFLVLGEILNESAVLKKQYERLKIAIGRAEAEFERTNRIEDLNPEVEPESDTLLRLDNKNRELNTLRAQRIKFYSDVQEKYEMFQKKIDSCSPMQLQLNSLANDGVEMELHETLFRIYVHVVSACLEIQLRRAPSGSFELQRLLPKIFTYIDQLVDTKMASSLCSAFLICGIICIEPADRHYLEHQYGKIKKKYRVKNFERTWEIVEEIWKRNDHGRKYIDWVDICKEKGWVLCLT